MREKMDTVCSTWRNINPIPGCYRIPRLLRVPGRRVKRKRVPRPKVYRN